MQEQLAQAVARLVAIFDQTDEAGERLYSREDLDALLPLIYLATAGPNPLVDIPTAWRPVIEPFIARLGLSATSNTVEITAKVAAYYATNPLKPQLQASLSEVFTSELSKLNASAREQAARMLGLKSPQSGGEGLTMVEARNRL